MRIAILDDYQNAALGLADWAGLKPRAEATAFNEPIVGEDALVRRLAPFDCIVAMRERTPFPRALIERLPKLKLLVTTGMRNAAIDVDAATARGIQVCGTASLAYPTAELTWGLILALLRHIPREDRGMRDGKWQTTLGRGLNGKVLGVIGLGRLGAQVARIGQAFGMRVIAWSANLTDARAAEAGATRVDKDELLAQADVVAIHLVLGDRSRGLIGEAELGRMKPGAVLINTSRGPIVDEKALVAALHERRIAGAGIDVYDEEPLPAAHPLRRLDNVVITPHLGYVIEENYRVFYGEAIEDIRSYLDGRPVRPLNKVA
ncbi:MAG: D-2-hydroxyacid dehydrogenase family protein [Alphaproteobacteria bacterium]|nr:D-2-hydroxyacid dehydrogenase family protein [Alphaproteobacteria bacterium]